MVQTVKNSVYYVTKNIRCGGYISEFYDRNGNKIKTITHEDKIDLQSFLDFKEIEKGYRPYKLTLLFCIEKGRLLVMYDKNDNMVGEISHLPELCDNLDNTIIFLKANKDLIIDIDWLEKNKNKISFNDYYHEIEKERNLCSIL